MVHFKMNKTASFFNDYSINRAEEDLAEIQAGGWKFFLRQTRDIRHLYLVQLWLQPFEYKIAVVKDTTMTGGTFMETFFMVDILKLKW